MKLLPLLLLSALTVQAQNELLPEPARQPSENFIETKAVVRALRGTARFLPTGGEWQPIKVSEKLSPGTVVFCGPESSVDLFLNNSVVHVSSDSILAIETLSANSDGMEKITWTRLELKQGKLLGNVKKLAALSSYEISTPKNVMRVRGTDFALCSNGKAGSVAGTIGVLQDGTEHTLQTGQIFNPTQAKVEAMPEWMSQQLRSIINVYPCQCRTSDHLGPLRFLHNTSSPYRAGLLFARRLNSGVPLLFLYSGEELSSEPPYKSTTPAPESFSFCN